MIVGYYPGCALRGTSSEYDESIAKVNAQFGLELRELEDWNCCGASSGHMTNYKVTLALNARNLKLATDQSVNEVLAPCPLCSKALIETHHDLKESKELSQEMGQLLEGEYDFSVQVINYLQLVEKYYLSELSQKIKRKFKDLKVACYYGCLLTRPPDLLKFDDPEDPQAMEKIVTELGAQPLDWEFKTECCGAGFTLALPDIVVELCQRILKNAQAAGAEAVIVACPMCHANLDMRQAGIAQQFGISYNMPVIYLSELLGLALGLNPKELGLHKHLVNTTRVVKKLT